MRVNPVLPLPRPRPQTARSVVDLILNARSADDLRLYGWEKGQATSDGRFRWKGTDEHKGQYRTQKTEPGTGRGGKKKDATAEPAAPGEEGAEKQPAQKKPALKRVKVDHNAIGDRIEKMLEGDFSDDEVFDLKQSLLRLTVAQLGELKKRFGVKGGRTKADIAGRIGGNVEGKRKPASAATQQRERGRQAALPVKSNVSASIDAVKINKSNLKSALEAVTKQFEGSDRKLSPNRAKELAAAKLSDIIQRKVADIDDRARTGKITPEEEAWYDSIHVDGWSPTRDLEMLSGSRTIGADRDMMREQPALSQPAEPQQAQVGTPASEVPGSPEQQAPRLPDEPEGGKVYNARVSDLQVDPSRFQYKLNTSNPAGVTDEMKSVKTWNPDFAGVISVWKDPANGKTYVVNGHHRHELASRLGAPELAVRYVKANSAREARAVGALINIAEGRGTAVDAAKFLRDSGMSVDDLTGTGVSLRGKVASDAAVLTRLNDRLFDRVARGLMDEQQSLAIAKHLADPDLQDQLVSLVEKREQAGKDIPNKVIEEMAREMAATPTTSKTERSLFGDIESTESLFVPRNELKAHIRNELAREVNDFAAVASKRRAARVAGAGNTLDVDRNREIAEKTEGAKNAFDMLVNRKGGISDTLNKFAEVYSKATTKREKERARQEAFEAVRGAVFAEAGIEQPATQRAGEAGGTGGSPQGTPGAAAPAQGVQPRRGDSPGAGLNSPVVEQWYDRNPTLDDPSDPVQRRKAVERAVAGGVKVPPEVLAQYPGLTPEKAKKAVREDRVAGAVDRYDNRGSLRGESGALFGGDDLRSREMFHKLPDDTEVVITDGPNRGRTGRIRREKSLDGSERVVAQLDGEETTTPVAHDAVEPLDDRLSWRTAMGSAPKKQTGIFANAPYNPHGARKPQLNARSPVDVILSARSPHQARPLLYAWVRRESKRRPGRFYWQNTDNPRDKRYQDNMPGQRPGKHTPVASVDPREHLLRVLEAPYKVADYYLTSLRERLQRMRPAAVEALRQEFSSIV